MQRPGKRDNFNAATIRKIKELAGDVCSMPDCRVITGGAKLLRDNTFSIGVAAHICAASPGGPRFDSRMSKEERKSYDNGIWLCQTHSRLIDVDPARFPVNILKDWKRQAEKWSMSNVGQKLISELEHRNAVRRAVGRSIAEYIGGGDATKAPIQDIILGYEDGLNELDSRFIVKVASRTDGVLEHHIFSKPGESADFKLNIKNSPKNIDAQSSLKHMIERGVMASFDSDNFEFSGSKLFEEISKGSSRKLKIGVAGKPVEVVVYLVLEDGEEEELANFKSTMVSGTKYGKITGQAFSGLLSIAFDFALIDTPNKFDLSFDSSIWIGQEVNRLGYFSNIKKVAKLLRGRGPHRVAIEIVQDRQAYRVAVGDIDKPTSFAAAINWHIDVLNSVRKISELTLQPIIVKNFNISEEDENSIFRCAALLEGDIVESVKPGHEFCRGFFSCDGLAKFDNAQHKENEFSIRYVEDDAKFFNILGGSAKPPPVDVNVEKCTIHRFSYIEGDSFGKEGFVVYAAEGTKSILSFQRKRQWVFDLLK